RGGSAVLHGVAVLAELERDANPAVIRAEPGAPDDVPDIEDTPVLEHRTTVLDAGRPRGDAFDAGGRQLALPVAQERSAASPHMRTHVAAERRVDRQEVCPDEDEPAEDDSPAATLDRRRDLAGVRPRQDRLVGGCRLEGDVGAGMACADDE